MFLSGLIEETKNLIFQYGADLPILKQLTYEAKDVLNNHLSIDKAIELTSCKQSNSPKDKKHGFVIKIILFG